jgi:hypothetical protein
MMATLTRDRLRSTGRRAGERGSIREVCLLGALAVEKGLESGDAVVWAGSSYHVVAAEGDGYVHVRPAPDGGC